MRDLDIKFAELEKLAEEKSINILNKHIYNLDLSESFLKSLPNEKVVYIHIKLHSLLGYKRFSLRFNELKILHDRIISFLGDHSVFDRLDY